MSRIRIAPIVEGHGEDEAIRILLQRTWNWLGGEYADILKPIRGKRYGMKREEELNRAIDLALLKLDARGSQDAPSVVLILVDADNDLPCVIGPEWLKRAQQHRSDVDIFCVIANVAYETWFVASAESLTEFLDLSHTQVPAQPEAARCGKSWIAKRFRGRKYSERVDQPRLTHHMDLAVCRKRAPSFDKLCRELAIRLKPSNTDEATSGK